ncbi:MAG: glutathione S-transferase family protein [Alphaproteobacteria bacterium]|nr:glutathione S-transferase family protein [Alphaproteobacteria bacterium]MBO6629863.1 glutathione S-transferase family protein [Alphaproteobacteria bacterium]MDF1626194.1 glutathione S-transferase family protein [Parvibaculaceae bacterium]
MGLIVYGAALSPFVRKVRVFLAEKGLDYTLENVNIFPMPDWFKELSPLKRIPVLKDEEAGLVLADSSAICGYLEKLKPAPALYPQGATDFGRALWFEEYGDSEMAAAIGMGTFRPIVVSQLMGQAPDVATAEKTIADKLPIFFSYLNQEIGSKSFLVGDAFSIADISVATGFVNFGHAGFKPDAATYPDLVRYLADIHARPSFAACIAQETAVLDKLLKRTA